MIEREDRKGFCRLYNNLNDPISEAIGKKCSKCKKMVLRSGYHTDNSKQDKMLSKCISCERERSIISKRKQWDASPDFAINETKRRVEWAKKNPERATSITHNYKARKLGNGGEFSYDEWADLKNLFMNRCPLSGRTNQIEREHFIPVSKGGRNDKTNIVPMNKQLNVSKSANNPFEWIETQPAEYYPGFWKCVEYLANQNGMTVKKYIEYVESFFSK